MDEGNGYANALKPHHFQTALGIPGLVASDTHNGLKAALKASLNSTPWQRCQSHLQHNAQEYVTKQHLKSKVASDILIEEADSG